MNRVLKLNIQLTNTDVTVCYGKKEYAKVTRKEYKLNNKLEYLGVSTALVHDDGKFAIVVGVSKLADVYDVKGTIVHELSHAVTQWMEEFGIDDDEVRSYTLQMLYSDTMIWLDSQIREDVK